MYERSTYNLYTSQVQIKVLCLGGDFFVLNLQTMKPTERYIACLFPAVESPWNWSSAKPLCSHEAWSQLWKPSYSRLFEGNFQSLSCVTNIL